MGLFDSVREGVSNSATVQKITELFGTLTKFILSIELAGANLVFMVVFLLFLFFVLGAITSPFWLPSLFSRVKASSFSDVFSKMFSGLVKFFK